MGFVVPGRLANGTRGLRHSLMCEQRDQREQIQERRRGPPDRQLRSLPLGLYSQMPTYLLKGHLELPAHDEPGEDPLRIGAEVGADQGLGGEGAPRVADQRLAQGHGEQARAVPDRRGRSDLHHALPLAVPVGNRNRSPVGGWVFDLAERFGRRSPFRRGLPICPGRRGGAGA